MSLFSCVSLQVVVFFFSGAKSSSLLVATGFRVPHLTCERNQEKKRDCMDRLVTPSGRGTSPARGPPLPCELTLILVLQGLLCLALTPIQSLLKVIFWSQTSLPYSTFSRFISSVLIWFWSKFVSFVSFIIHFFQQGIAGVVFTCPSFLLAFDNHTLPNQVQRLICLMSLFSCVSFQVVVFFLGS